MASSWALGLGIGPLGLPELVVETDGPGGVVKWSVPTPPGPSSDRSETHVSTGPNRLHSYGPDWQRLLWYDILTL